MLVEQIPDDTVLENPGHIGRFEKRPRRRHQGQRLGDQIQQAERLCDVLNHVTADVHIGRHGLLVKHLLELQAAVGVRQRPDSALG